MVRTINLQTGSSSDFESMNRKCDVYMLEGSETDSEYHLPIDCSSDLQISWPLCSILSIETDLKCQRLVSFDPSLFEPLPIPIVFPVALSDRNC